jgi:hypothetical protein
MFLGEIQASPVDIDWFNGISSTDLRITIHLIARFDCAWAVIQLQFWVESSGFYLRLYHLLFSGSLLKMLLLSSKSNHHVHVCLHLASQYHVVTEN